MLTVSGPDILETAEGLRTQMVASLERLVRMETPSHDSVAQADMLAHMGGLLADEGYAPRLFTGATTGGFLYARPARRRRRSPIQLILGHSDTVWPNGTLETMPVRVEESSIAGPGVYDMKGGLTQIVYALRVLRRLGYEPPVTPAILVNSDEEIGSRESTHAIRRLARIADRAYVLEPSLGPEGRLKTARKGVGRFTIVIQGRAAHAGLDPTRGASAIVELAHVIQKLHELNDHTRGVSVNVGQIDGGLRPNVVAPESRAIVDVRVPTHEDAARIEELIHNLEPSTPGITLHIQGRIGRPPMEVTPRNRRLWEAARVAGQALGIDLQQGVAGGGSDGNTASLFTATLDGLGAAGDGAHAAHEHVMLDSLVERTALLAMLIMLEPLGHQAKTR